ncbi:MAG TPA: GH116 family glycosyl hydrolase, partial [Fimbriimonadaceae bacterium]|nr:GH116 family glycosyl hydrolase [Fimbriimonadaceae bacterium]
WPRIKKAMQYLIGHDANGDGLIEDSQPNTFDIDFFGANTFVGSLYLGALRAAEEMAKEVGDTEFASQCRDIFEKGSAATVDRLWNGEYFIQDVDETVHEKYQYGPGCLSDQLFGQGWAHQVGLGHIYPEANVKTGLQSVWKYNFAPDVAPYNARWAPERPFAVSGEAGLFVCTWPKGGREDEPVRYRDEVWTGIEYQVAGNMVWDGMAEEGLSICRAVHDRYQPIKRNPYNEVECSDHYARAMASWGVYTALSGFSYHGPAGRIGFAPRVTPSAFRAAFTAAEGWGTFDQRISGSTQTASVYLAWGRMHVSEIALASSLPGDAKVTFGGRPVASTTRRDGDRVVVALASPMVLSAQQMLTIRIG